MVTGGDGRSSLLASTETLVEGQSRWTYAAALPSARYGMSGATPSNRVILTGGTKLIIRKDIY